MSRGSVIKRGDGYTVKLELPRDPQTGKRRQKWVSGFKTKKEAERARTDMLAKLDAGTYVEPTRQNVSEYLSEWFTTITPTLRESTLHSYRRNMRHHVESRIGSLPLAAVDGGTLNGLYAELMSSGRWDGTGGLSPRTVRYVHTILHRAFKDAVRWGRLARNPADAADPPRAAASSAPEILAWSEGDLRRFLTKSRDTQDRYYPTWVTLATTGARRGEILGLRWSDVDLATGQASVRQTVVAVAHEVRFGTPKTDRGRRRIALDPGTVAVLKEHRRAQAEERLALGPGYNDHGLVFAKVTGDPLHPERVSREFDRRIERWELPRITLHGLRHTWATLALQGDVHPRVVQERLGHATIAVTLGIYSHVTATLHDEAATQVAAQMLPEIRPVADG